MYTIYSITYLQDGRKYIGQTSRSFEERMKQHIVDSKRVKTHLYNAIRKYGLDNFRFEIIDYAESSKEADYLERYYIEKFNSIENGFNMIDGGASANPMLYKKAKDHHDQIMRSKEVKDKISRTLKQYYKENYNTEKEIEHRRKLSEQKKALYASPKGEEVRRKFRESFKLSETHKEALMKSHYKSLYCIDEKGKVINTFDKVKDAAQWWMDNGYPYTPEKTTVMGKIKESDKFDKFVYGLKWIYCKPCVETIES